MTSALTSRHPEPARVVVQILRGGDGNPPEGFGGAGLGWQAAPNLRCDSLVHRIGPMVGHAQFTYIPLTGEDPSVEAALDLFSVDDQVRVTVLQPEDLSAGTFAFVHVFTGYLARHGFDLQTRGDSADERVTFTAFPLARLDNKLEDHLIAARWLAQPTRVLEDASLDPASLTNNNIIQIESPTMPAVFNFDGHPNKHPDARITANLAGVDISAPVFTHDSDPNGQFWTVRDALASILVYWLAGIAPGNRHRFQDIDQDTATALAQELGGANGRADRYLGFDAQLPETNVHGLGVLDAIEQITRVAGFDFAARPVNPRFSFSEYPYELSIWRKGTGPVDHFELDKRGAAYANERATTTRNNMSKLVGQRDAAEIVNRVRASGRSFLEVQIPLKPLWLPEHVDDSEITDDLKADPTQSQLDGEGYFARHVPGGALYDQYGHVGRAWGVDCTGRFTDLEQYEEALYKHPAGGFDWVTELGLIQSAKIVEGRSSRNQLPAMTWSRRMRQALPLRNVAAVALGIEYILQVSEDGGTTWRATAVPFDTLSRDFGIVLNVKNLASVNGGIIAEAADASTDVADSWWALIDDRDLAFRLTCTVEADHAPVYLSAPAPNSPTGFIRGQALIEPVADLHIQPQTPFNVGTDDWVREPQLAELPLESAALRRRDALEDARLSVAASTWIMDIERYPLGTSIASIRGRDISLATSAGQQTRLPNVVAIEMTLAPAESQSIRYSLEDRAMTQGGR